MSRSGHMISIVNIEIFTKYDLTFKQAGYVTGRDNISTMIAAFVGYEMLETRQCSPLKKELQHYDMIFH